VQVHGATLSKRKAEVRWRQAGDGHRPQPASWPPMGLPMLVRMKLTKRAAARRSRRSELQQAPGLGLPMDVVDATVVHMRSRGVLIAATALVFRMTTRQVREILARHRLAAVHQV
jgi:hypothetical protein